MADTISRSAAGLVTGVIKGSLPATYCAAARNELRTEGWHLKY